MVNSRLQARGSVKFYPGTFQLGGLMLGPKKSRKAFLIQVVASTKSTKLSSMADREARRASVGKAYQQLVQHLRPLLVKDPQMFIHPNRDGATLPIFVIETLGSLKTAIRSLPGVKSVTTVRTIRRIA
jgi:hypothetical protein